MAVYDRVKHVICQAVTALTLEGKFDEDSSRAALEHAMRSREKWPDINAFLVNCSTEALFMPEDIQDSMLKLAVEEYESFPILQGIFPAERTVEAAMRRIEQAKRIGAKGIVLPPLLVHGSNRGLPYVAKELCRAAENLPAWIFNDPVFAEYGPRGSKRDIKTGIYKRILLRETQNVFGIIDNSCNHRRLGWYRKATSYKVGARAIADETRITETFPEEGCVSGLAFIDPLLVSGYYDKNCKFEPARLAEAVRVVYCGSRVRGVKAALKEMGIFSSDTCLEPGEPLTDAEKEKIRNFVVDKGYVRAGA